MIGLAWSLVRRAAGAAVREPLVLAIVVLLLIIGAQRLEVLSEKARRTRAESAKLAEHLNALNARAKNDTTQDLLVGAWSEIAAVTRQATQEAIANDSLSARLHLVQAANVELRARVAPVAAQADGTTTRSDMGRVLAFHLEAGPFPVEDTTLVPDDTARPPVARLHIALAPAPLRIGVGCVGDTARVLVATPPWLRIDVDHAVQDPRVCRTLPSFVAPTPSHRRDLFVAVSGGVIAAIAQHNLRVWLRHRGEARQP